MHQPRQTREAGCAQNLERIPPLWPWVGLPDFCRVEWGLGLGPCGHDSILWRFQSWCRSSDYGRAARSAPRLSTRAELEQWDDLRKMPASQAAGNKSLQWTEA